MPSWTTERQTISKQLSVKKNSSRRVVVVTPTATRQVIPHPAGCPRRLFCGCGASMHLFGAVKPGLMLAANWLKFPRAEPAPGMVAANRGHVFVIDKVLSNGMVMAYDYNSGGGRSHYHMRSLRGFTVVNPRG